MIQAGERIYREAGGAGPERAAIVFVSASAEDARAFRDIADGSRWLVVNIPDLTGARAVIGKLHPRLVVCDTEIEGQGSWRDLLRGQDSRPSFGLIVISPHADEALRAEVLGSGGIDVFKKPLVSKDTEGVIGLILANATHRVRGAPRREGRAAARGR